MQIRQNAFDITLQRVPYKWICYCLGLLFLSAPNSPLVSQTEPSNLGIPPIRNFAKKEYGAGTQNWEGAQDTHGMIYWANNDGLLRYNGNSWIKYPVSNNTIIRSVEIDSSNRIYVGAQGEMGYFSPGQGGILKYHSLVGLLPKDQKVFEDVWDIVIFQGTVFFRTNRAVYQYRREELKVIHEGNDFTSMFSDGKSLYLQEGNEILLTYQKDAFQKKHGIQLLQSAVTGCIPWKADTILLTTLKHGILYYTPTTSGRWKTSFDQLLTEKRIYSATFLSHHRLAIGTSLDGLIIIDADRRMVRHLNKQNGLQNNNVLTTFADQNGHVWLGLDNGIDCVIPDSRFTYIFPDGDLQGTGYAATVKDNTLFLGVSNGVYKIPWQSYYSPLEKNPFEFINGSDGQVWSIQTMADQIWMGHHEGAFSISDHEIYPVSEEKGVWRYIQLDADHIISGSYHGLSLYEKSNNLWHYAGKLPGLDESCRIMVRDDAHQVWVSHPYRGLFKVQWTASDKFNPVVTYYDQTSGLPSNLNNYVFLIAGKALIGTERGVYRYDATQNKFIQDSEFNSMLGDQRRVKHLHEDPQGNIWYVAGDEVGILLIDDHGVSKKVRKVVYPELTDKLVGGFEFIYPVDSHHVLFGTEQGFIMLTNPTSVPVDTGMMVLLSSIHIRSKSDSLLFGGYQIADDTPPVLAAHHNNLIFDFASTEYELPGLVEYRTMLQGLEKEWSGWSNESSRTFTNLSPGKYQFMIQARVPHTRQSPIVTYVFRIRPPWYKTPFAFAMYGIGIIGLFAGVVWRQRYRFETEKAKLTVRHQQKEAAHIRQVEESQAALTEIQNEKLEVEIKYKNQELALTTMHLVQKAELLLTVQESLNQIQEKSKTPEVKKEIQQLLNLLNFDVNLDEDWEHFAHHFDQVHVDFLKNLRERFPQLSSSDFKLCAYLRMNLSTKEIAPLLNISVRGVEGSRYRLRKKLLLDNDVNLTDFILGLPPSVAVSHDSSEKTISEHKPVIADDPSPSDDPALQKSPVDVSIE